MTSMQRNLHAQSQRNMYIPPALDAAAKLRSQSARVRKMPTNMLNGKPIAPPPGRPNKGSSSARGNHDGQHPRIPELRLNTSKVQRQPMQPLHNSGGMNLNGMSPMNNMNMNVSPMSMNGMGGYGGFGGMNGMGMMNMNGMGMGMGMGMCL